MNSQILSKDFQLDFQHDWVSHIQISKSCNFFSDSPSHVALSEGEERCDGDTDHDHEQRSISLVLVVFGFWNKEGLDAVEQLGVDSVGGGGLVISELLKDEFGGVGG